MDSLQLAHELGQNTEPLKAGGLVPGSTGYNPTLGKMCLEVQVALLNGANRKLCGNHWFQSSPLRFGLRYVSVEELKSACSFCMKH